MEKEITKKIRVYGIVQGVGFRPTVSRHADFCKIRGSVSNRGPYVEIFAQGSETAVNLFIEKVRTCPPKRAAILKVSEEILDTKEKYPDFSIIESEKTKGEIFISPDIAICEECKEELYDPKDRRYLHPFINCTCCGPRLTILDALPYDRERTSMKEFPMCPECEAEYYNPESRRYDAQPVCCNMCGPEVYLIKTSDRTIDMKGSDAITEARRVISEGGIVAVKGIGGFHLCCDASNEAAVELLRKRKRRPAKPFAVMARNLEVVQSVCELSKEQEEILTGHQKPILLLVRNGIETKQLCSSVAPGNPKVGVMLPYAPVQLLLFQYPDGIKMPDFLVMTSGNVSGAPICRSDEEALEELSEFCDCILSHNRKIRVRADDSVMDFYKNRPYMIRRSRGYAPLPIQTSGKWKGQVLAAGGELKNTFCIGVDSRFYPSAYVGDLEDLRTVNALKETIQRMETLLEVEPSVVVCDMHPKYNSTVVAEELGLPVLKVQHHYAHILSCMAENDWMKQVIGVSFDGTGYGTDGTIWGGEILLADLDGFRRIGSIEPFLQAGGDLSAKEGWRIAVSLIWQISESKDEAMQIIQKLGLCEEKEAKVQLAMLERKINAVESTSAGRLFDGISAILGIRKKSSFEGEASMALEFAAEAYEKRSGEKKINVLAGQKCLTESADDGRELLLTSRLVRAAVEVVSNIGENAVAEDTFDQDLIEKAAYEFHKGLAEQIITACIHAKEKTGCQTAALSGGVFQNGLLLRLTEDGLIANDFHVLTHQMIPPNDGGVALGQAFYGMNHEGVEEAPIL